MKFKSWMSMVGVATVLAAHPAAAGNEYLIQPGDVLELSVVGVPQLLHKGTVGLNGAVTFPLIDDVSASGRTIDAVRAEVRARLSTKVAPRQNGDGVTDMVAFTPEQIGVSIADYRPIYINGNVIQPGEQKYRIGMTAREAVSVAGGLESGQAAGQEYAVLLNELAFEQIRLFRLESERQRTSGVDVDVTGGTRTQPRGPALALANTHVADAVNARRNEAKFLQDSIESAQRHIAILRERRTNEADGYEQDKADFERASDLFKKGVTVALRVSDARRNMLISATQLLQTDAAIATAEREILGYKRQIDRLNEQASLSSLTEIEQASHKIQDIQTKLMFAQQMLPPASATSVSSLEDAAVVSIVRSAAGEPQKMKADLDTLLRPGDVVTVSIPGMPPGGGKIARKE